MQFVSLLITKVTHLSNFLSVFLHVLKILFPVKIVMESVNYVIYKNVMIKKVLFVKTLSLIALNV